LPRVIGSITIAAQPNIGGMWRASYVIAGAALTLWGLFGAVAAWARIAALVIGGALLIEGVIGFCLGCWVLGRGSKSN
jgi:ABC-type transport system involved in multi-copper enzyme maturation permease subunit